MIFNPTRRGGTEKEYTITNNTRYSFPATAKAGEIITYSVSIVVTAEDGTSIPTGTNYLGPGKRNYFVVMPAQNVTISTSKT